MSGTTTRLGLYKPGGGSDGLLPDESVDVGKFNGNSDLIDAAVGALKVTSGTHPSTPFEGQIIRETDTGNLLVYEQSSSTFVNIYPKLTSGDMTGLASQFTFVGNGSHHVTVQDNQVTLRFKITNTGLFTFTAGGGTYTLGTLPTALRPKYQEVFPLTQNGANTEGFGHVVINTDGTVVIITGTTYTNIAIGSWTGWIRAYWPLAAVDI